MILAPSLQHEPKLKSISLSSTLNRFVSCIIADIIELILLKEVGGRCTIGLVQDPVVPCHKYGGL